jgi:hypothetical protein
VTQLSIDEADCRTHVDWLSHDTCDMGSTEWMKTDWLTDTQSPLRVGSSVRWKEQKAQFNSLSQSFVLYFILVYKSWYFPGSIVTTCLQGKSQKCEGRHHSATHAWCIYTYMHMYASMYWSAQMHIQLRVYVYACMHAHHLFIATVAVSTSTHTCTHTHTHSLWCTSTTLCPSWWSSSLLTFFLFVSALKIIIFYLVTFVH